jgi:hypothetical protein
MSSFSDVSFFHIYDRFYLALHDRDQAEKLAQHEFIVSYVIVPLHVLDQSSCADCFYPHSLTEIYEFDGIIRKVEIASERQNIVFCSDSRPVSVARSVFLIGCHIMMHHNLKPDEIYKAFEPLHHMLDTFIKEPHWSLQSCWRALDSAKRHRWVDFQQSFKAESGIADDEPLIEEYLHYARYIII